MRARRLARWAAILAAASIAGAPARAEDNGGFGGFFQHLFGPPPPAAPPTPRSDAGASPRPASATARKPRKKPAPPREASAPATPTAPPATATKFVYVLGDSMAIAAADGMADDLQSKPDIGVIDRARDASGLVRDDYFDWPKAARDLVAPKEPPKDKEAPKDKDAKAKPTPDKPAPDKPAAKEAPKDKIDFVVIMLGINDLQQMKDGKDYVDPLSERWKALYAERIQAMTTPLRAAHVPVIWVGLPPMRTDKVNAEMIVLNQMFKDNAERAGAKFIDIFDDFADQNGQFDAFGPNIEGQRVKLRGSDGIHLTAAGGKKLAHFLDVEVLKALDQSAPAASDQIAALPPDANKAADDINEQIRREMGQPAAPEAGRREAEPAHVAAPKPEAGAVASLAARPVSPGAALASPASVAAGEAERLLRLGEPPHAEPGRADDFSR